MSSAHPERERVYAEEECLRAERAQALRDIMLLMRRYEISTNELEPLLRDAETDSCSGKGNTELLDC